MQSESRIHSPTLLGEHFICPAMHRICLLVVLHARSLCTQPAVLGKTDLNPLVIYKRVFYAFRRLFPARISGRVLSCEFCLPPEITVIVPGRMPALCPYGKPCRKPCRMPNAFPVCKSCRQRPGHQNNRCRHRPAWVRLTRRCHSSGVTPLTRVCTCLRVCAVSAPCLRRLRELRSRAAAALLLLLLLLLRVLDMCGMG
jgi:hypothetical protein